MRNPNIEKLKHWCQSRSVDLCVLFGSQTTGKTHARSDLDIALYSANKPDLRKVILLLKGELEDHFGQPVNLVIIDDEADPELRLEAFRHGEPVYESEPGIFVEELAMATKVYDDTEPLRRLRDRVQAERSLKMKCPGKERHSIHH